MFGKNKDKSGLKKLSVKEIDNRLEGLERKRIMAMATLKSLEKQRESYIETGRKADGLERRNIAFKIKALDSNSTAQKKLLNKVELGTVALQKLRSIKTDSGDLEDIKKITSYINLEEIERAISEKSLSDEQVLEKLEGIANLNTASDPSLEDPLGDYMNLWDDKNAEPDKSQEEAPDNMDVQENRENSTNENETSKTGNGEVNDESGSKEGEST